MTSTERLTAYVVLALTAFGVGLFVAGMLPGWVYQAGFAVGFCVAEGGRWLERRAG